MIKKVLFFLLIVSLYIFSGKIGKLIGQKNAQNSINSSINENLPKMIDELTRLDKIITTSFNIKYQYTIMVDDNISLDKIKEINATIIRNTCNDKLLVAMNNNKTFIHRYINKKNDLQCFIKIEQYFCKNMIPIKEKSSKNSKELCDEGKVDACMKIAKQYDLNNSIFDANKYYNKACDLYSGIACFILAKNSHDIFHEKNYYENKYRMSCEFNIAEGCTAYGLILFEQKNSKSTKYLELGCQKKSKLGCRALGNFYIGKKDVFKAIENYNYACEYKDGYSCNQLGIHYAKGIGVRKNIEKARDYFGLSCDNKNENGCTNYANMGDNWEYHNSSQLYKLPILKN